MERSWLFIEEVAELHGLDIKDAWSMVYALERHDRVKVKRFGLRVPRIYVLMDEVIPTQ